MASDNVGFGDGVAGQHRAAVAQLKQHARLGGLCADNVPAPVFHHWRQCTVDWNLESQGWERVVGDQVGTGHAGVAADRVVVDQTHGAWRVGRLQVHGDVQGMADAAQVAFAVNGHHANGVLACAQNKRMAEMAIAVGQHIGGQQLGFLDAAVAIGVVEHPQTGTSSGNAADGEVGVGGDVVGVGSSAVTTCDAQVEWCRFHHR